MFDLRFKCWIIRLHCLILENKSKEDVKEAQPAMGALFILHKDIEFTDDVTAFQHTRICLLQPSVRDTFQ